jgi:ATP-binding cassette subfamily B protein
MMFVLADNEVYCRHLKGLYAYLDIPNRKEEGTLTVNMSALCNGSEENGCDYEIEFCNVSFRYPGAKEYSLRNLSLKFKIGKRLAIVGKNGSGKSTFIKLLCRLYDPTEGEIRLNGVDIRKYDYEEYLKLFSVVFQDFKLFSFSLGQNVATAMEYDREKAEQCLLKAGLSQRLESMPKGLDTALYKDFESEGVEISGGEAQKVALARALYKDAPVVVLDEPTAALDPIAEAEVYTKFNEIIGDKTAIYISHRLSSCKFCDEIAVFDEGAVVQRGSHEVLLQDKGGLYHELWTAQAQYYEAG